MTMDDYAKVRSDRRRAITALKRHRRLGVGPAATFYFESFETMWMQIHEMLFIEQGGLIGADDERFIVVGGNRFGLQLGKTANQFGSRLVGQRLLIHRRRIRHEG